MRKINTQDFQVATRTTSRQVNRRIALSLIREHQAISRAELARKMDVARPVVTMLVNELIADGAVYEGRTEEIARGRKPVLLHVKTRDRFVVAVDVRFSRTFVMLSDFSGKQIALESFDTIFEPDKLVSELARRIKRTLKTHEAYSACEGVGLVIPGVIDGRTGRVVNAPQLGWRDVEVKSLLAAKVGLPVSIENASMACALAQMWLGRGETNNFVYVTVSDGVGVGIVINGELMRGESNTAGEFGHNPINLDGAKCLCGNTGCWEAYTSNIATLARYLGRDLIKRRTKKTNHAGEADFTIDNLIALARAGDEKALAALRETARYLGIGLAIIINSLNPARVFIGGEITAAWDLIADDVRRALAGRAMTQASAQTPIIATPTADYPRLRGATALIAASAYAAPRVA